MNSLWRSLLAATAALAGFAALAGNFPRNPIHLIATSEYGESLESRVTEKETLPIEGYMKSGPKELRLRSEMVNVSGAHFDCCRT